MTDRVDELRREFDEKLHRLRQRKPTGGGAGDLSAYQLRSEKGDPSGYAELAADGLVPTDQLGTGTADTGTFLRGDGTWEAVAPGDGDFIGATVYDPVGTTTFTNATTSYADLDAVNLSVSFVVPSTGKVIVRLTALVETEATNKAYWGLREGSSNVVGSGQVVWRAANATPYARITAVIPIADLTPGDTKTWKWSAKSSTTDDVYTFGGGGEGPMVMEVHAADFVVADAERYVQTASTLIIDDASYYSFPGVTRRTDNTLFVVARVGTNHLVGGNLVKFTGNATGSSWSAPTTIIDTAKDIRDTEVMTLASGDLICTYTERSEGLEDFVPKCMISTDDGATWGSPITITNGFTGYAFITAKIVELAGGDLLAPIYGINTGGVNGTDDYCRVSRSTDGGATWSNLATIVATGTNSEAWTEPQIALKASGDLVCMIRCEDGPNTYMSTSTDDGATWSAPVLVFPGGGRPSVMETADGALVVMNRAAGSGAPRARWSFDDGVTWSGAFAFGSPWAFVYGSWVTLLSGDLGALWSHEDGPTDMDANLMFDTFEYVP